MLKDFNAFFLIIGSRERSLLSGLLFFIVLEVLASIKMQEKYIKAYNQDGKVKTVPICRC